MADLSLLQPIIHYGMHYAVPAVICLVFFKQQWKKAYIVMLLTMLVDLDHLLADPFFDPQRCSINFHPLHTYYAMIIYALGLVSKKTRIVAIGLLFHMLTDWVDCQWM